jgi:hypothetical protein
MRVAITDRTSSSSLLAFYLSIRFAVIRAVINPARTAASMAALKSRGQFS